MKTRKEATDEKEVAWIREIKTRISVRIQSPFGDRLIKGSYQRDGKNEWIEFIGGPVGKNIKIILFSNEEDQRLLHSVAASLRICGYSKIETIVMNPEI